MAEKKPKTKLEGLQVTKVDVVDVGADQEANIMIRKRDESKESVLKKFFNSFLDAFNVVSKGDGMITFNEQLDHRNIDRIREEVWDTCFALQNSIGSILADEDVVDKAVAIRQSIDQFVSFMNDAAEKWADFKTTDEIKKSDEELDDFEASKIQEMIEKSCSATKTKKLAESSPMKEIKEEMEEDDMKLDVTKMSPVEKAFYEELQKKYSIDDTSGEITVAIPVETQEDEVAKAVSTAIAEFTKGLQDQMEATMAPMRKRAEEMEAAELAEVAKKYEILGMNQESLVPILKNLKDVSKEAYDNFVAQMDANVTAVEKSGLFSEIGKSGSGSVGNDAATMSSDEAWAAIEKRADDMMVKEPALTRAQAIDRVCIANPALVHAYEK